MKRENGGYYSKGHYLPTVAFGLDVEIPESAFKVPEEVVAKLNIRMDQIKPLIEVTDLQQEGEQESKVNGQ